MKSSGKVYLLLIITALLGGCVRPIPQDAAKAVTPGAPIAVGTLLVAASPEVGLTAPPAVTEEAHSPAADSLVAGGTMAPASTVEPPARAGQPARLVFRLPRQAFAGRFDLDGSAHIFTAHPDGSELAPISLGLSGDLRPLGFSSEGKRLLVAVWNENVPAAPGRLYTLNLDGSGFVELASNLAPGVRPGGRAGPYPEAVWAGEAIVFIGVEGGQRRVFRVNEDGSRLLALSEPGEPVGALLETAFITGAAAIPAVPGAAETAEAVTTGRGAGSVVTSAIWARGRVEAGKLLPDCDPTCYTLAGLEGGFQEFIWPGVQQAALAATGRLAYHLFNEGGWQAVPVYVGGLDGSVQAELEPTNACSLVWSPDGTRVLVGQLYGEGFCGEYLLWTPETDPLALPEELPSSYSQRWSPDSRKLLFEDWSGAWIYDLESEVLVPALEAAGLPLGAATDILWAPED